MFNFLLFLCILAFPVLFSPFLLFSLLISADWAILHWNWNVRSFCRLRPLWARWKALAPTGPKYIYLSQECLYINVNYIYLYMYKHPCNLIILLLAVKLIENLNILSNIKAEIKCNVHSESVYCRFVNVRGIWCTGFPYIWDTPISVGN